jgi:hypothetical protein
MNKHLLWLFALLMMTACGACSSDNQAGDGNEVIEADSLVVGDKLPEFKVTMSDGSMVRTADLLGKPSVVVLFSIDCMDCRHQLPQIQRLWDMNQKNSVIQGQRIPIVLIARECTEEDIEPFWKFSEFTMPYSPQPNRRVYSLFAPRIIPRIYISDAQGIIRYMHVDIGMPTAETIVNEINELKQ